MSKLLLFFLLFGWVINSHFTNAQTFTSTSNPIVTNKFTADPATLVHDNTLYLYVGHDEAKGNELFNMKEWLCYSTKDMKTWTDHGVVLRPTDFKWAVADAWASQVVEKGGKFYFYSTVQNGTTNSKGIGVAVADSPVGPFIDAIGSALITDDMTKGPHGWDDIDPTVFIDDDGTPWMLWGNANCYKAKLKPNMIELDGDIEKIDLPNYIEGPWLHKRNDIYYITYASHVGVSGSERIAYATASNMQGPWTYEGILTGNAKNSFTIHPAIAEFKGQWYLFYHNADLTINGEAGATGRRAVCVDRLYYDANGLMYYVEQTEKGVSLPPKTASEIAAIKNPYSHEYTEIKTFENPVIFSDVPDIDVIRVGSDYYMVSTTMHLMPGAPIMKSKDLVNWQIVNYLYDEIKDSPQYDLEDGNIYGQGQWASSLRYHKGKYYVLFATNRPRKTYIFSTENPEGKWEKISEIDELYHDASLLFDDDGKIYLVNGSGHITIKELESDLSGVKKDGLIVDGVTKTFGLKGLLEGSHINKYNGKYYIFMIWWPQGGIRTQLCFRADKLEGPYEMKTILSDDLGLKGRGIAQGCIVDTEEGDWYGMLFQDHGAVGRIPILMSCRWVDGWPILGDKNGKVAKIMEKPKLGYPQTPLVISDDFKRDKLALNWQWNHNPDNTLWSLTERPGYLRLKTGKIVNTIFDARNTLSQRTEGPACSGIISMDIANMKDGDIAGLGAFCAEPGLLSVKKEGSSQYLIMTDRENEKERIKLNTEIIYLRMDCDFNPDKDIATFYYSLDNKKWIKIGSDFQMIYNLVHFMGNRFAIYNYATKSAGGYVDIDFFKYSKTSSL